MSVTITIANNRQHTLKNGSMLYDEYECCVCHGETPKGCTECGETGVERFERLPYELNVANGNFSLVWNCLGLDFDYCGEIDPRVLQDALRIADPELMIRGETIDKLPGKATVINCGTHPAQVDRYLTKLAEIANEAARREEMIVWG